MKRAVIPLISTVLLLTAVWVYLQRNRNNEREENNGRVVQRVTCINNLKEIGIGFKIWAGDHDGQFPFNVSTNAGGSWELCAPDKNGFDHSAYLYLKTMTNELLAPLLLVCPQDRFTTPAASWKSLQASNVSYHFRCGTNVVDGDPQAVLAICPIDGNVLYADGMVVPGTNASKKEIEHQGRAR